MASAWDSPGDKGQQTPPLDMPAVMPDAPVPREGPPALPEGPHPENSPGRGRAFRAPLTDFPPVRGASANPEPLSHSQLSPPRGCRRIPAGVPGPAPPGDVPLPEPMEPERRRGEESREDEEGLGGVRRLDGFWYREQKRGRCFWGAPRAPFQRITLLPAHLSH